MSSAICDSSSRNSARLLSEAEKTERCEQSTYGEILKSSALIGGSSVLTLALGIVRTKAMAMLLGPAGFGLFGLYGSIANLAQSVAGMGVNSSGVRQIAEAAGTKDVERIAQTATVLRRTSILLGALGAALLAVFSRPISTLTFGTSQNAYPVSFLSIAVFFTLVSNGQGALIQGMRRIADLAKIGVLGALFGTLISIPMVYFLREQGVVPSLVGVAGMTSVTSWWYSRKIRIPAPPMTGSRVGREAAALLKLGFAFMASAMMMMGSAYVVRIIILRRLGLEATGYYQAAWTLGGLYVGFILQAMGADFYPRLTASANDNTTCNRLVNEQARIGVLLANPGVTGTLTFASLVIALFYDADFEPAVSLLRWICLGVTMRVVTWPMGFIILAKGKQDLFFLSELAWTVIHIGLARMLVSYFGLNGAGVAFCGSYVFHGVLIYAIVRKLTGFRWSAENRRTGVPTLSFILAVFCSFYVLPRPLAIGLGALALVLAGTYSTRVLLRLAWSNAMPYPMRRLLARFGSGLSA